NVLTTPPAIFSFSSCAGISRGTSSGSEVTRLHVVGRTRDFTLGVRTFITRSEKQRLWSNDLLKRYRGSPHGIPPSSGSGRQSSWAWAKPRSWWVSGVARRYRTPSRPRDG